MATNLLNYKAVDANSKTVILSIFIDSPLAQDYTLLTKAPVAMSLDTVTARIQSGTSLAVQPKGGTGGSTNIFSNITVNTTRSDTGGTVSVAAGDRIVLTLSALTGSPVGLELLIKGTRTS